MGGLTWTDEKGNWGVNGLDWRELGDLRPKVYGALCKLKDMETLADKINGDDDDASLAAIRDLSAMGRRGGQG